MRVCVSDEENTEEGARIFKEFLETTYKCFVKVVFAIPSGRDGNLTVFKECLMKTKRTKGILHINLEIQNHYHHEGYGCKTMQHH